MRSLPVGAYTVRIRRMRVRPDPHSGGARSPRQRRPWLGDVPLVPQPQEIAEIVVPGAKPVIDPVSAAAGFSARLRTLPLASRGARLSRPHRVRPAGERQARPMVTAPISAVPPGLENAFYVDGMHVTVAGGSSINLPFNLVREIQVITGGYEAEHGRALSGVVNVVTPSGGNEFHSQALGFFTNDRAAHYPTGPGSGQPGEYHRVRPGLSLSGPILRDRLWFFAAYDPTVANQDASLAALTDQRDHRPAPPVAGKLTWRAGPATDAALTFIGDPFHHDVVVTDILPLTTTPEVALGRERGGGTTVGAQVRHELDSGTPLDFAVSRLDLAERVWPGFGLRQGPDAFTRVDDFTVNASSGGLGFSNDSRESRTALRIAATAARGRHTVKVGAADRGQLVLDRIPVQPCFSIRHRRVRLDRERPIRTGAKPGADAVRPGRVAGEQPIAGQRRIALGGPAHVRRNEGPNRTIGTISTSSVSSTCPGEAGSQRVTATAGRFFLSRCRPLGSVCGTGTGRNWSGSSRRTL